MASLTPDWEIHDETKCPICLEYFTDPVSVECGHNFCRSCISQCCEQLHRMECPICRGQIQKKHFRPNWDLANIVGKVRQWDSSLSSVKEAEVNLCVKHKKSLDLFCEEDREAVCVVCERSPEHSSHTVLLLDEAAQKCKEQIQTHLQTLKEEREKLKEFQVRGERESQEWMEGTEADKQEMVSEFQQLHQFLQQQEHHLLAHLEQLQEEIRKKKTETFIHLSEEISHFTDLITEVEGKCQQPVSELLQDFRSTLTRCEKAKLQQLVGVSPELEKRVVNSYQINKALKETLKTFKGTLLLELEKDQGVEKRSRKANITLDPKTVHPCLLLSEDLKSVRLADIKQKLPNNPERFNTDSCVLGQEGFTSGRHYWEVDVGVWGAWAIGVATESVKRKGQLSLSPEQGTWAIRYCWGQFLALTSPETPFALSQVPRRIRVFLDYEAGQVVFLDADSEAAIFLFPTTSFTGKRIVPFFWLWDRGCQLRLCP